MKASPGGEIAILLFAIIMIVFFLFREIGDRNKTSWRLGLSDFLMRPVNQSNQKSFAVIGLGIVFICVILFLILQRILALWG